MPVITYREALNQALAEEMQRDPDVFLMGEEVGVYNGAYKVSKGLLEQFGETRVVDTPITELGFAGLGRGRGDDGDPARDRVHDRGTSRSWPSTRSSTPPARCAA
jgi:pyruvate dehydrogenase E1 component beta subunit